MQTESPNRDERTGGHSSTRGGWRREKWTLVTRGLLMMAWLVSASTELAASERSTFQQVVSFHVARYPTMEIEDLYKLAFQAAMGSEHAVPSREAAWQWLERELSNLSEVPNDPLSEPLSPDGSLVRVNLRAMVEHGGEMRDLLDAFVQTANEFEGSEDKLRAYWSEVVEMAATGVIPFDKDALEALFADMEAQGFPAVHHSATYREHYHPAYRVVLLELLESDSLQISGQ